MPSQAQTSLSTVNELCAPSAGSNVNGWVLGVIEAVFMGVPEFKTREEAKAALDRLDEELLEGKITEEEYRARKAEIERQIELMDLEDMLIEGKITEEEYKKAKASLLGEAKPAAPPGELIPSAEVSEVAQKISQIASKLAEVKEKREKLRELLISKEISEPTFQKLDSEYEEKENSLELRIKELEAEAKSRLKEIEQKLEEIKLMREEIKARHLLGETPEAEFAKRDRELEAQAERLKAEQERISSALELAGLSE